jgi:glycosyltransferase involved in cell wall biosynthesis
MATQFSIIIACYNQKSFIRETVESALAQHPVRKQIIVVDDASTDGTQQILREYGEKIEFVECQSNQGATHARNLGASMATGDYLVFLDGDDALLPWALDVYAGIIDLKRPKVILGLLFPCKEKIPTLEFDAFVQQIRIIDLERLAKKDRTYWGSASALVVERQTFADVKGWRDGFFPAEVDDLQIMLACAGRAIQIASPPTTCYRLHSCNASRRWHSYISIMHKIIRSERAGEYPGGPSRRFERYVFIGGPVFSWVKWSLKAHRYRPAMKLMADGWPMILAAIASRLYAIIRGRRPLETLGCNIDHAIHFCAHCARRGASCPHGIKLGVPGNAVSAA